MQYIPPKIIGSFNSHHPNAKRRGKNYLLAIAINKYRKCPHLNNAVNDVETFILLITKRYDFQEEQITKLINEQATKRNIEKAFIDLARNLSPEDNLIIYFSGHGRYDPILGGHWVPVEAGPTNQDFPEYLSNDLVKGYLQKNPAFHIFLIADSCFSGSLFIDKSKDKFPGSRIDEEMSRWGLTSGKKEIVSDGEKGQHSPFAKALIDVLKKANKPVTVMELWCRVHEKVVANAQQSPMGSPLSIKGHQGGQFIFYPKDQENNLQTTNLLTEKKINQSNLISNSKKQETQIEALSKKTSNNNIFIAIFLIIAILSTFSHILNDENSNIPSQLDFDETLENSEFNFPEMVSIKGGIYRRGSNDSTSNEYPKHSVTIKDFFLGKHEVTNKDFCMFLNSVGKHKEGDTNWLAISSKYCNIEKSDGKYRPKAGFSDHPVIEVSWIGVQEFIKWLSKKCDKSFRLPTEAEWEYAAGGGARDRTTWSGTDTLGKLSEYSNFCDSNCPESKIRIKWQTDRFSHTSPIGSFCENVLGLKDISGNVFEMTEDCWHENYENSPLNGKAWLTENNGDCNKRVCRGGAWNSNDFFCKVSSRSSIDPSETNHYFGFRLAHDGQ